MHNIDILLLIPYRNVEKIMTITLFIVRAIYSF